VTMYLPRVSTGHYMDSMCPSSRRSGTFCTLRPILKGILYMHIDIRERCNIIRPFVLDTVKNVSLVLP
jgi:hypothetical protein